jgi:formylglycine-generating enzyme required for sulfatase activity
VAYGIFASRFPLAGRTVWTLVNRAVYNIDGAQLRLPAQAGMHYFDLWHGAELTPVDGELRFAMEALGYGAVLAQPESADAGLRSFLAEMHVLNARPLSSFPKVWQVLPQQMVAIERTAPAAQAPAGMVAIPGAAQYRFHVHGVEIEGGDDIGVDVQYPGEDSPRRHHAQTFGIPAFYMDRYNVTNREFAAFVKAAGYRPADDHNFLKDWKDDDRPVTWVSLEDARAYARWAGKRLPHEWEWQYAAQGLDGRQYPWGNAWCEECVPVPEHGRELREPEPGNAHPKGASPFGVMDLTGNVWQWTDEFQDAHTRAATLRGGGYYRPSGSRWYFPSAYRLDEHGKYLLMAPSKDRAGTLGFRCVKDAE